MTPLKPTGFWSYSSADDAASDGRLSRLRQLLANELQQRVGRQKVHLFQDVAAIPPGTQWERQIEAAVGEASFLIPVITPGFLQSEWCAREVRRFRVRMEAQRRTDLILPVHYLDVDAFDTVRRSECADPDLFVYLRSLQWVDFRGLEPLDSGAAEVRQGLGRIATAIVEALYRDVPALPIEVETDNHPGVTAATGHETADIVTVPDDTPPETNGPPVELPDAGDAPIQPEVEQTARAEPSHANSAIGDAGEDIPPAVTLVRPLGLKRDGYLKAALITLGILALLCVIAYAIKEQTAKPEGSLVWEEAPAAEWNPGAMAKGAEAYNRKDYAAAFSAYSEAARQGDPNGEYWIGLLYDYGLGVTLDYHEAMRWYRKAADHGNVDALWSVGLLYIMGDGVVKDPAQARIWIKKAADAGNPDAKQWIERH